MAFLTMSMYSSALHMDTNVNVILPERRKSKELEQLWERKYQVLYLLHGMGDDHTAWIRKSNIELVAREYNIVVVMPTTARGMYVNQKYGEYYYDYLVKELPIKIANFFPISKKREDTFIAGNSMGGYGALRIALANPDKYAGAASLSGSLQPYEEYKIKQQKALIDENMDQVRRTSFGTLEEYLVSDNNLVNLAEKLQNYKGEYPKLYLCCGTEDSITYCHTQEFMRKTEGMNLKYTYTERKGGHNWTYWNPQIQEIFNFFGFEKIEK